MLHKFQVQREIVTGLKYVQRTARKGIQGRQYLYDLFLIKIYLSIWSLIKQIE